MSDFYSDARYGVIERKVFSLTKKYGGDAASGITFNETQSNPVARWYPKGPIQVLKLGVLTLATLGKGEELFGLTVDGTSTVMGTVVASTSSAPGTIASKVINDGLSAGSYLAILASTNVCSTGSVAIFVEYRRKWSTASKHVPTS